MPNSSVNNIQVHVYSKSKVLELATETGPGGLSGCVCTVSA